MLGRVGMGRSGGTFFSSMGMVNSSGVMENQARYKRALLGIQYIQS